MNPGDCRSRWAMLHDLGRRQADHAMSAQGLELASQVVAESNPRQQRNQQYRFEFVGPESLLEIIIVEEAEDRIDPPIGGNQPRRARTDQPPAGRTLPPTRRSRDAGQAEAPGNSDAGSFPLR